MMKKMNILLFCLFAAFLTFCYLALHHYGLIFGLSATSLCQISQSINCDGAALSTYSEFLGIPIALFGASFSLVLFVILLMLKFDWLDETPTLTQSIQFLLLISAILSVFLGYISVFKLGIICPFCFLSYILSFISCILVFSLYKFNPSQFSISDFFDHKGFLTALAMIPFLAWFASSTIQTSYGYDEIKKLIPEKLIQWKQMPIRNFNFELGLIKGDLNSLNTLVEFADFKCPHCKSASDTLKNFEKSNPSIKIIFKPFPLDGNCNSHVSFKGDGSRCQMSALALCSEKLFQKGWAVHDYFFKNQDSLMQITDIRPVFKNLAADLKINSDEVIKCSESSDIFDQIQKMADEAKMAEVEGTPSLFMNNQKLGHGQFFQVLKAAYLTLK